MEILLAITFVFGVLRVLTSLSIFDATIGSVFSAVIPYDLKDSVIGHIFHLLGTWFFFFSLIFQAWYWLFSGKL